MLSPSIIAKSYTLEQINTKITKLQISYEEAVEIEKYSFDDVQAKQSGKSQDLDKLSRELNTWLKAKYLIISGEANTKLYAGHFTGKHD